MVSCETGDVEVEVSAAERVANKKVPEEEKASVALCVPPPPGEPLVQGVEVGDTEGEEEDLGRAVDREEPVAQPLLEPPPPPSPPRLVLDAQAEAERRGEPLLVVLTLTLPLPTAPPPVTDALPVALPPLLHGEGVAEGLLVGELEGGAEVDAEAQEEAPRGGEAVAAAGVAVPEGSAPLREGGGEGESSELREPPRGAEGVAERVANELPVPPLPLLRVGAPMLPEGDAVVVEAPCAPPRPSDAVMQLLLLALPPPPPPLALLQAVCEFGALGDKEERGEELELRERRGVALGFALLQLVPVPEPPLTVAEGAGALGERFGEAEDVAKAPVFETMSEGVVGAVPVPPPLLAVCKNEEVPVGVLRGQLALPLALGLPEGGCEGAAVAEAASGDPEGQLLALPVGEGAVEAAALRLAQLEGRSVTDAAALLLAQPEALLLRLPQLVAEAHAVPPPPPPLPVEEALPPGEREMEGAALLAPLAEGLTVELPLRDAERVVEAQAVVLAEREGAPLSEGAGVPLPLRDGDAEARELAEVRSEVEGVAVGGSGVPVNCAEGGLEVVAPRGSSEGVGGAVAVGSQGEEVLKTLPVAGMALPVAPPPPEGVADRETRGEALEETVGAPPLELGLREAEPHPDSDAPFGLAVASKGEALLLAAPSEALLFTEALRSMLGDATTVALQGPVPLPPSTGEGVAALLCVPLPLACGVAGPVGVAEALPLEHALIDTEREAAAAREGEVLCEPAGEREALSVAEGEREKAGEGGAEALPARGEALAGIVPLDVGEG